MPEQHNHSLDGALHTGCPACDYIRSRTTPRRNKADREIMNLVDPPNKQGRKE